MAQIGSEEKPVMFRKAIVAKESRFRKGFNKSKYDQNYEKIFGHNHIKRRKRWCMAEKTDTYNQQHNYSDIQDFERNCAAKSNVLAVATGYGEKEQALEVRVKVATKSN